MPNVLTIQIAPGHDINDCWALKNKIQDRIDNKTIEFDPPPSPNVITAPMPSHGKGVNAIKDASFISSINDLTIPLKTVKKNLLKVGIFPGYFEECYHCNTQINGCTWLKKGVQHMMDSHEILFEKIHL